MKFLNSINSPYKFNSKQLDEETGNYYYGARYYDPKTSIWLSVDPMMEKFPGWSPYNYTLQNPVKLVDPDGRSVAQPYTTIVCQLDDGTYQVTGWVDDGRTDVVLQDGTKVGESLTTHSFVDGNNNAVVGAIIDTKSSEGQDFIDKEIIADNPNINHYRNNAKLNEHYDFKSRRLDENASEQEALIYRTRGSMTSDGKMASARDFGNMAAGIVASRAGVPDWLAKMKFNELQGRQEPPVSAKAQQIGLNKGDKLFWEGVLKMDYEKSTPVLPITGPK